MESKHRIEDISASRDSSSPPSSVYLSDPNSAAVAAAAAAAAVAAAAVAASSSSSTTTTTSTAATTTTLTEDQDLQQGRKDVTVCVVCGDTSSGKHYGILACNGCSGFFKRSVRRKLIYRCQAGTGLCVIDKAHRNQCQACRLRKCLHMGMNKDAVQNERQPRNTATLRPESFSNMDSHRFLREASVAVGAFGIPIAPFAIPAMQQNLAEFPPKCDSKPRKAQLYEEEKKADDVGGNGGSCGSTTKGEEENKMFDNSFSDLKMFPLNESNHEIAARLLFMAVRWTKNLTSFASLPFRDQVTLLEESWSELFLLCAIQWSLPLEKPSLFTLANPELHSTEITTFVDQLAGILGRYKRIAVNPAEFACMKAILLFKPETQGLKDHAQVDNLQDQALVMLSNHIESTGAPHVHASSRFGRLLLLLSNLRLSSSVKIEKLYFDRIIGNAKMEKLLCDMFQS